MIGLHTDGLQLKQTSAFRSEPSSEDFDRMTALVREPDIGGRRTAVSTSKDQFCRKQTLAKSGPMSETRTKRTFSIAAR